MGGMLVPLERHYVCGECAHTGPALSRGAMTFLRSLGTRTPWEVTGTGASQTALREIEHVHQRLITMHLEKELRSTRVIKELRPHP